MIFIAAFFVIVSILCISVGYHAPDAFLLIVGITLAIISPLLWMSLGAIDEKQTELKDLQQKMECRECKCCLGIKNH